MVEGPVVVSRKGEARILRGHPWIFRTDVVRAQGITPGAVVRVEGSRGRPLGFAFYSDRSEIRLRMIDRGETLSESFLRDRVEAAVGWRQSVAEGAAACRLVHGEGDRLPSLIVDRYGDHLVVQTLSQGTEARKDELVRVLVELLRPAGILERNDPRVRALEGLDQRVGLLYGEVPERVEVKEGDVTFEADLWRGQKTGLFLDQRENHLMARAYARGRVLDGFSYHGGFALHAARVAREVLAVDTSAEAVAQIVRNAERNGLANVAARDANLFDLLRELHDRGERFDTVILDPPAFAKSKDAVEKAVRGYKEINLRALKLLEPGGCLITCSCSYHVHEADFEEILAAAAADASATVTVVEKRRQARDHPVVLGVPETYYLKCFVLRKVA
ncbi:MAG TPA: class I SAM-dependent rRNA methyltransferase [Vicinamibacteria bacterium]|nr:class I SAM-dependent rRNA methyltransferase [Vicinamibacteria bacterium]